MKVMDDMEGMEEIIFFLSSALHSFHRVHAFLFA